MTGFGDDQWLQALWLLPIPAILVMWSIVRRRRVARRFAETDIARSATERLRPLAATFKGICVIGALGLVMTALARPLGETIPTPIERSGRDVIFMLDVSRSMWAEDLAPNRLERAKLMIQDTLESLEGDRVALVAFAGTTVVAAPLTVDYGFVRMALDGMSPDSVSRGGSLIGDAIRKTMAELIPEEDEGRFRDIILLTDGEDHDSFPAEAALEAADRGVRIIVVGLGDHENGSPIPIRDERGRRGFIEHNGEVVRSRLKEDSLRDIALSSTNGLYLPVRRGDIDLGAVYRDLRRDSERRAIEEADATKKRELFQWALLGAFALLIVEGFISERRRPS